MTTRQHITVVFVILTLVSGFCVWTIYQNRNRITPLQLAALQPDVSPLPDLALVPTPLPTPQPSPSVSQMSQTSPDGTHTVILTIQSVHASRSATLSVKDAGTASAAVLYTAAVVPGQGLAVPFNAWSPDNMFVFITTTSGPEKEYVAFPASGKTASEPVRINELFKGKFTDFAVTDVTGWAAPGLLIVNTAYVNGDTGPSFWFSMHNRSFMRLSTRF